MNLRIVESANIHTLPVCNLPDVATAVHAFAECIEEGTIAAESALLITIDERGCIDIASFGEPLNNAEALGYLDLAKGNVIARMPTA